MPDQRHSDRKSPLDGGWGWVIVVCCFMVTVCTRGVTRSLSVFSQAFQDEFKVNYTATMWIQGLQEGLTMIFALVARMVTKRWSSRVAVMVGSVLAITGFLSSSFSTSMEQLYFTMGVLPGLGFALCYTPAIAMVSDYFPRCHPHQSLAYGIAMSGNGIGAAILAPVLRLLIDQYSWRVALGFLTAFGLNLFICGILFRPIRPQKEEEKGAEPVEEAKHGNVLQQDAKLTIELSTYPGAGPPSSQPSLSGSPEPQMRWWRCILSCILSSPEYRLLRMPVFLGLAMSFLFLASGCNLPFIYLGPYTQSINVTHHNTTIHMTIMGVMEIVGNISFGWLMNCRCLTSHRVACYMVVVALVGLFSLLAPLLTSFPQLMAFAFFYGYFTGAYNALIPVVTSELVGEQDLFAALGLVYSAHGIPYLVTPPMGGWLVNITGSYTATFFFSGAAMLISSVIFAIVAGIHNHRHRANVVAKETNPEPRPPFLSNQSDDSVTFREQAVVQDNPGFTLDEDTKL